MKIYQEFLALFNNLKSFIQKKFITINNNNKILIDIEKLEQFKL